MRRFKWLVVLVLFFMAPQLSVEVAWNPEWIGTAGYKEHYLFLWRQPFFLNTTLESPAPKVYSSIVKCKKLLLNQKE